MDILLTQNPRKALLTALAVIAIMLFFTRIPPIDSSLTGYDVENNPYYLAGQEMTEAFGSGNMIQVKVDVDQDSGELFLVGLGELSRAISAKFDSAKVESLHKARRLIMMKVKNKPSTIEILKAAREIPLVKNLVSNDDQSVMVVVFVKNLEAFDINTFDSLLQQKYPGIEKMGAISQLHIQEQLEKTIARDYIILLPFTIMFISLYLAYSYRSFRAVIYCLSHVVIAVITSVFYFSAFGIIINQITTTVIPVSAILSISASVHLLTGYVHQELGLNMRERLSNTFKMYLLPSFLSSFTTAIAFASFVFSQSLYIRQFGLITAITVMTVFIITYMLAPMFLPTVKINISGTPDNTFSNKLKQFILSHNRIITIVFTLFLAISVFLLPRISFRTNLETFLPRNTPVFFNNKEIKESFHSLAEIDLMIEAAPGYSATRGEIIGLIDTLSQTIGSYPETSSLESLYDQIEFEKSFGGISGIIFPRSGNPFVSVDQQKYRINIKLKNAEDIWKVKEKISEDFKKYQPRYSYTSYSDFFFFHHINSTVTQSLMKSLIFSGILIMLVILFLTRNLRLTAITLLSNLIPLGFLVWAMVVFDTELSIAASMTLVISLGMIVDDSIHILYRKVLLKKPLGELGFGIVTTSVLLGGGFLSFILSQSLPNQVFGALCALAFVVAMVSDLAVMSLLIKEK